MSWTYSLALTAVNDQIRLLIGDTIEADPLLQDEEIAFYAAQHPTTSAAAAACCEAIAARMAREADTSLSIGNEKLSLSASQRSAQFRALATTIRTQASRATRFVAPRAGGLSQSQKAQATADTDRVAPAFRRDLHLPEERV